MKIKLFLILLTFFSLSFSLIAQNIKVVKEFNSSYYELKGLEVNLTSDKILIALDHQNIFTEDLSGKKIFQASPGENYFLIANFKFSNEKADYPVEIRVFDRDCKLVFPYKFFAPYDLPHSLFHLNDNALLALFDPLSFKVKLIEKESYKEIELAKDIPFEMEKASFMEINEDFLFILTPQKALDITENASNVTLFKVNLQDLSTDKKELDYNSPTLLKIINDNVFISGVKFENLKPVGKTIKYDFQLNQLSSNEKIIEKLIPHGNKFYAKYFNTIYELNNDLSISIEKKLFGDERILDLAFANEKLIVVTNVSGENIIYSFLPDLRIDIKEPLDNFGINRIENFSISGNNLIIRHDSKSVKIKTNRN